MIEKSNALVRELTGGDPGLAKSLEKMYQDRPTAPSNYDMDVDQLKWCSGAHVDAL